MERKTKTPEGRRSGIYSKREKYTVRLQTPYTRTVRERNDEGKLVEVQRIVRRPFVGKTVMREAFENIVPPRERSRTVGKIMRALKRGAGTYKASGWRVRRNG